MTKFNGHRSWNAWNVSLWINNDETLYRKARELAYRYGKDTAAIDMLQWLVSHGMPKTPDGAIYNKTSIREALRGME